MYKCQIHSNFFLTKSHKAECANSRRVICSLFHNTWVWRVCFSEWPMPQVKCLGSHSPTPPAPVWTGHKDGSSSRDWSERNKGHCTRHLLCAVIWTQYFIFFFNLGASQLYFSDQGWSFQNLSFTRCHVTFKMLNPENDLWVWGPCCNW